MLPDKYSFQCSETPVEKVIRLIIFSLLFFFLVSISLFSKWLCYAIIDIEVELKIRNGSNPAFKIGSRLHCLRIPFLIEKS